VRIGPRVFDSGTRELTRDGVPESLAPKAVDLLVALLEERPRAVSRERLHERVWRGTHVSGASLNRLVAELRAALGDDAREPALIRTVPRFGYAFSGAIEEVLDEDLHEGRHEIPCGAGEEPSPGRPPGVRDLWLIWEREEVALREGEHFIGRDPEALIRVGSARVSRRHAMIRVRRGEAVIEDLGSKNGTFVGGRRIDAPTRLEDRAQIQVGSERIVFRAVQPLATTETGRAPDPTS